MGEQDHQEQRDAQGQDRIDAMQRSLDRLQGDMAEQRHVLDDGRRDLVQRQRALGRQQRDLVVLVSIASA